MSPTRALLRCDDANVPSDVSNRSWSSQKPIRSTGQDGDLSLRADSLAAVVLTSVDDHAADLVRIASYVYAADQIVSRGGPANATGSKWRRHMVLCLPVSHPGFWQQEDIHAALADSLRYLTDDEWEFHFSPARRESHQIPLMLQEQQQTVLDHPNSVVLFSGGADSLCTAVEEICMPGNRPVIVSHRSSGLWDSRQQALAALLRQHSPHWGIPHLSFWIHRRGSDASDSSQRSRGFLFASLGAAVASQLGISRVLLGDNGVVSLNLPINAQLVGALASRATHPEFLRRFNVLCSRVFSSPTPVVENPLALRTRAETFETLATLARADLIHHTVSCSHTRGLPAESPQCGYCSQCLDRRFGAIAAGLEEHDPPKRYSLDVFTHELHQGEQRTVSESLVRHARTVSGLAADDLITEYPQVEDALDIGDPNINRTALQLIDLVQRHARQVLGVVDLMISRHSAALAAGTLPADCLLRLVAGGDHRPVVKEPVGNAFVRQGRAWRIAFDGWRTDVNDSRGMSYIARLLRHPYQSFHATDLSAHVDSLAPPSERRAAHVDDAMHIDGRLNDPLLDKVARADIARKITELRSRRADAEASGDIDGAATIDGEIAAIESYVEKATGRRGRSREFNAPDEKARSAVSKAIRRAQIEIATFHPALGQHLRSALRPGIRSTYAPESPVEWTITIDPTKPGH